MGFYGLLTELNLDSVSSDAYAPETLGVRALSIKELDNNRPLVTQERDADKLNENVHRCTPHQGSRRKGFL